MRTCALSMAALHSLQRTMLQIGGGLIAALVGLIATLIGLMVTQL